MNVEQEVLVQDWRTKTHFYNRVSAHQNQTDITSVDESVQISILIKQFMNRKQFFRIKVWDSHGVVEVSDDARRLARRRVPEARVVGVAEDPLNPRQRSRRRHGLVGEVTCRQEVRQQEVKKTSTV